MLLLTDADASPERPPVPMLLATAAVHHRLVAVRAADDGDARRRE